MEVKSIKNVNFNLYRFQILPKDRHFQGALFGEIINIEDLIAKKNDIFAEQLISIKEWKNKRTMINGKLVYNQDNFLIYRFASKKTVKLESQTFEEEQYENWPSILVAIWNQPDKQYILIQDRKQAFADTKSVLNTFLQSINGVLGDKQLKFYAEPIFYKEAFWNIINEYPSTIKNIKFELITPNMANISATLSEDLKNLAKGTNTAKTFLEIDADDSKLHITHEDKQINSLVDYASEGGGNISIKIKGLKKRIQTSKSIKSLEIKELEIKSGNFQNIANLLQRVINEK
ncbi:MULTISPECIES: hypothetical protein [unclassified Sulfurospirillum]|uniref:hypothetical protein n=1 Tax=unclassified Sulfurospirillum TaxID=2618290 RepID=UPI000506DDEC|nr:MULTISPECIES: hypothetical protein [unclassified Sulfurospirillum]KFL35371.1 hypothetical protein JU57_01100 [Sulfurospirillum sp. SCADC]